MREREREIGEITKYEMIFEIFFLKKKISGKTRPSNEIVRSKVRVCITPSFSNPSFRNSLFSNPWFGNTTMLFLPLEVAC